MERLRGVPLTDLAAIRSITSADPELVLVNALNAWFGSVLAADTFHADMHAGASLHLHACALSGFSLSSSSTPYRCGLQ